MSSSPLHKLKLLYFGDDPQVKKKLNEVFGEDNCAYLSDMKQAFDFLKSNHVTAIIFDTYQVDPFKGINSTDLDLLIYYNAYEEGKNKTANFLPIDQADTTNISLNTAESYYGDLYDKHLFLLPPTTLPGLNEDSINQPEEMELLSNLIGVLDEETDKLDKRLEKVSFAGEKGSSEEKNHHADLKEEMHTVDGFVEEKDNFVATLTGEATEKEEAQTVAGSAPEKDDHQEVVSGGSEPLEEAQRVSGSPEEQDNHKEVIAGEAQQADEVQLVKGLSEEQDNHKEVIAGEAQQADEAQLVKGLPDEQDNHKEVIAGEAQQADEAQLVKGLPEEQDNHKEVIAGDIQEQDKHKEVISGDVSEQDKSKEVISGTDSQEDNHKEVISGENEKEDDYKVVIPGTKKAPQEDGRDDKVVFASEEEEKESKTIVTSSSEEEDDEPGFYEFKKPKKTAQEEPKDETVDINQRNDHGQTPPMVFALKGDIETVRSLLSSGAKADLLCHKGKTLLHYAAAGTNDLAFIEELVHVHNLKVTKRDSDGNDPMFEAIRHDNDQLIDFFLNEGARINAKYKGEPVLHVAARHNALKAFKVLLLQGADLKVMNGNRENIIAYCKKQKKLPFLKLITAVSKLKEMKGETKTQKAS